MALRIANKALCDQPATLPCPRSHHIYLASASSSSKFHPVMGLSLPLSLLKMTGFQNFAKLLKDPVHPPHTSIK